jgi:hypothetical protein
MKIRILWDVAPFSHVEVYRHFSGSYCLYHHHPDDEGASETPDHYNVTKGRYIPEDSKLNTKML